MRDKLIELIQNAVGGCARHWAELIADHLIAHGVTFAEDNNVPIKPMTNGNRIRAMSDEGLARFLDYNNSRMCVRADRACTAPTCKECIMEWLKQEEAHDTN